MKLENGRNSLEKGTVLFQKDEEMRCVGILLSGKVQIVHKAFKLMKQQGTFLGLSDIENGKFSADYLVVEDAIVLALPINGINSLKTIIGKSNDYRAIVVSSQYKHITMLANIRDILDIFAQNAYQYLKDAYAQYHEFHKLADITTIEIPDIDAWTPYENVIVFNEDRLIYYEEASKIPLNVNKVYFSYSKDMAFYQAKDTTSVVWLFSQDCINLVEYIEHFLDMLIRKSGANLFELTMLLGKDLRREGRMMEELVPFMEEMLIRAEQAQSILKDNTGTRLKLPIQKMREKLDELTSNEMSKEDQEEKEAREAVAKRDFLTLPNSMQQIITFSGLQPESIEAFCQGVEYLVASSDKLSSEDDMKKQKKNISKHFFDLYLACYRNTLTAATIPAAVRLFLNYGYIDERLLKKEQLMFLCSIQEEEQSEPCHVYTLCEWLEQIRTGKKDPSKSDFDEDYIEYLRNLKKQGEITEEEQTVLLHDANKRVEYEVMNLFKSNDRACYGQPSTYAPVLYDEAIFGYLEKIIVTRKKINDSIKKMLEVDYSAFYREVLYSNSEIGISNETIMKNVYPDIIIIPVYGINATMWQEISGKNKATPGRFVFPVFSSTNIDDLMLKMFGRFRWELCRCIMGMSWNDIKYKSLTSEYMDYIQFYRKNRELSEEWRQKIKLQIQKGRNNSREVFLIDYVNWIRSESSGSMKMNKVAREIIATYIPFAKTYREKLGVQRNYELAMARFNRNVAKKRQEAEFRIRAVKKVSEVVPEELLNNYDFYNNN